MNYRSDLVDREMARLKLAGVSYREIGRRFGCSPNTVRTRTVEEQERQFREAFERELMEELEEERIEEERRQREVFG